MSRNSKIVLAFVTVSLAWGCSYFSIRIGLESMPPLLMGGIRYALAGILLWIWCSAKGEALPTARQWLVSALLGLCFVVIGNGTVLWAEQTVPSGITALLIAVTPLGTLMLEWAFGQRKRPSFLTWIGLALGLIGIGLLVAAPTGSFRLIPTIVILLGTTGWSLGSALSIRLQRLESPIRAISAQMLCGSFILFILGFGMGEGSRFHFERITLPSIGALIYLIFIASIAAYIAYGYLMHNVSPTAAGVCSYINPIVAMLLGGFMGEPIGAKEIGALVVVLFGVALLSHQELRRAATAKAEKTPIRTVERLEVSEACA